MSCYIYIEEGNIQELLNKIGKKITIKDVIDYFKKETHHTDKYPVCLIHLSKNITSAPILYNKNELRKLLSDYGINNSNEYYIVPIENLKSISNIDDYI